jgi:hypothetical protein
MEHKGELMMKKQANTHKTPEDKAVKHIFTYEKESGKSSAHNIAQLINFSQKIESSSGPLPWTTET